MRQINPIGSRKQTNLSVFIPHMGCPHACSFCNQRSISGAVKPVTPAELEGLLAAQVDNLARSERCAEIAFFGGSFTAIERGYMIDLLDVARGFTERYPKEYVGIRCSTRPDCIDEQVLSLLKAKGMTAIELGAQSMDDEVLTANERGHNAAQVRVASGLIKSYGFSLGLQMMTGLYKDSPEKCRMTAREFIAIKPDTVRIYPTVILKGTRLGELYESGAYDSFGFEETIELCADLLTEFNAAGIKVIRLGLHSEKGVTDGMLGGVFHPAFREICESRIYLRRINALRLQAGSYVIYTDGKNISKIYGQKKANKLLLSQQGIEITVKEEKGTDLRIEKV